MWDRKGLANTTSFPTLLRRGKLQAYPSPIRRFWPKSVIKPQVSFSGPWENRPLFVRLPNGGDAIDVGIPAMGEFACREIEIIDQLNLPSMLTCWCRAVKLIG